jgi:hypothetical protein
MNEPLLCLLVLTLVSIIRGLYWRVFHSLTSDPVCLSLRCCLWMNHSSIQASYNRQQRKDKQTGSEVNEWTTRQYRPVLTLLSIIRGLCWRVVYSLTSDPVCLSLRCCLLYEACIDEWFIHWLLILFACKDKQTGSEVNEWTTRQYRPRIIDNNVKTNKQDQKSSSFIDFWSCLFVLTLLSIIRGLYWRVVHSLTSDPVCLSLRWCLLYEACVEEWFIHWLLILFVCPYVGVYYARPVLTSGQTNRIRSQWLNHSSTQASYNRQQRKYKQTGSEVNEWTTRQYRPRIIDNNARIPAENHGLNQVFAKLWFLFSPAAKCSTC